MMSIRSSAGTSDPKVQGGLFRLNSGVLHCCRVRPGVDSVQSQCSIAQHQL